jgi:hypothetical protein
MLQTVKIAPAKLGRQERAALGEVRSGTKPFCWPIEVDGYWTSLWKVLDDDRIFVSDIRGTTIAAIDRNGNTVGLREATEDEIFRSVLGAGELPF